MRDAQCNGLPLEHAAWPVTGCPSPGQLPHLWDMTSVWYQTSPWLVLFSYPDCTPSHLLEKINLILAKPRTPFLSLEEVTLDQQTGFVLNIS